MPELEDVYKSLRAAHDAGDVVAAQKLADYARQLQSEEQPQETTALGQAGETLKAIPRGFGRTLLTAAEGAGELADAATNFVGLENLIDSGDDNALVSAARQGQKAINESWLGVDDAYQDEWLTKFGEGLGSMATFFTPTAALRLAGLTGRATKTTGALASATGSGEQAQRIEQARAEGLDVTGGQEDTAILTGAIIGLSELAPVERILRGIDPGKATDDVKTVIMKRLSSAFASGGMEALQETSASLLQDLAEREIYNPDVDFGQEALDSFTIGGAVGFTADLVVNADVHAATLSQTGEPLPAVPTRYRIRLLGALTLASARGR